METLKVTNSRLVLFLHSGSEQMEDSFTYRLQSGEGRPGLETVLRDKTSTRERPPVPAVRQVAVEMRVPVEGVVRIHSHPSFPLRFSPICRTGDEEGASRVLLKATSEINSSLRYNSSEYDTWLRSHLLNYRFYVVNI